MHKKPLAICKNENVWKCTPFTGIARTICIALKKFIVHHRSYTSLSENHDFNFMCSTLSFYWGWKFHERKDYAICLTSCIVHKWDLIQYHKHSRYLDIIFGCWLSWKALPLSQDSQDIQSPLTSWLQAAPRLDYSFARYSLGDLGQATETFWDSIY